MKGVVLGIVQTHAAGSIRSAVNNDEIGRVTPEKGLAPNRLSMLDFAP